MAASVEITSTSKKKYDPGAFSVLLIGESQNGKSSFGNILLGEEIFQTGDGTGSCTGLVQSAELEVEVHYPIAFTPTFPSTTSKHLLTVIDTPGLNETKGTEDENIIMVYQKLDELRKSRTDIATIFLVLKYGDLVDQAYRDVLQFYLKIFRDALANNLVVIYTHVEHSEAWKRKDLRMRKKSYETVLKESQEKLKEILGFAPPHIEINCLPDEDENQLTQDMRLMILKNCLNMTPIKLQVLLYPEPPNLLKSDNDELIHVNGQIDGIEITLGGIMNNQTTIDSELRDAVSKVSKIREDDIAAENRLKLLRFGPSVRIHSCTVTKMESLMTRVINGWLEVDIDQTFEKTISRVSATMGNIDNLKIDGCRVHGKLFGFVFRNIDCLLTFYTESSVFHKKEIKEIVKKLKRHKTKYRRLQELITRKTDEFEDIHMQIENYISERKILTDRKSVLKEDYAPLKDLMDRLGFKE